MKILVVSQYYLPEPGAPANRVSSFVDAMVRRGHEVTVICEFPNYPTGILQPQDRWRLFRLEKSGSYNIIRAFVMTFSRKNNIKRMIYYLSFAFSSFLIALFVKRCDIVFTSSPPIFHAFAAMLAAKIKRSKFIADIRDLWPDTALQFKAMSNKSFLKWGRFLEKQIYKNAQLIFTISKGVGEKIDKRGGAGKVYISYNGSDEKMLNFDEDISGFRRSLNWDNKIIVLYAGIIGLGQNLKSLLPLIRDLNNRRLHFVFIGDGPFKPDLENEIADYNLKNVQVLDSKPRHEIVPYLKSADILLVTLIEAEFFKSAIPSKFFDYMAAGKPILTNVDGELREILEQNNTGAYFSLKKPGSFEKALNYLVDSQEHKNIMGENGRKLVREKFLRSKLTDQAVEIMEQKI